jgi:transcriptional regulator with XRE-family HTH domain
MSDLSGLEKRKFERPLGMGNGYVLDFSNRTFAEFVNDSTGEDIYADRYNHGSGSKANRLRGFWAEAPNHKVARLIADLLDHGEELGAFKNDPPELLQACRNIIARLEQAQPVADLHALAAVSDERDFEIIAAQVREAIEKGQPEAGLDRLHTFTAKFVKAVCERHGIAVPREKPLHGAFGEYVKRLREQKRIDSEMAERILKSTIATLESFNHVRNQHSLAHDNPALTYDESILIFNHVASVIRFVNALEDRINRTAAAAARATVDDEIPF